MGRTEIIERGDTMPRTKCGKCKCWNTKHMIYKKMAEEGVKIEDGIGICERHAPRQIYINQVMTGPPSKMFPTTQKSEGCWEGYPKK